MHISSRKGFALPMAIGAIVLIGTMLAGAFFVATQENRLGGNTVIQEQAFRAAELGISKTINNWQNSTMRYMGTGAIVVQVIDSTSKGWLDTVKVTRLNGNTYQLTSIGSAGSGPRISRHRTGAIVKVSYPTFNFLGALTVRGAIKIGGSSYINGADQAPTGWTCGSPSPETAGVAAQLQSDVTTSGCTNLSCVNGNPQIQATTAAGDTTTYFNYGSDANWATLTSAANLVFTGSPTLNGIGPTLDASGNCDKTNVYNWGDPNRAVPAGACETYFPIIYFQGTANSVHISGGTGQGILLVDGDLIVDGGFTWYGPVIVRGHVTTQGTGGHFNGGVMASNVDLEQNTVLGAAIINYSTCAVSAAIVGAGVAKRLVQRSWMEMF